MDIKPPLVIDWNIYECTKITLMGGDGNYRITETK